MLIRDNQQLDNIIELEARREPDTRSNTQEDVNKQHPQMQKHSKLYIHNWKASKYCIDGDQIPPFSSSPLPPTHPSNPGLAQDFLSVQETTRYS